MHTRRRPIKAPASTLTLDALEPRTLFSVSASLAQLIYLNTPHNVNPNVDTNPPLILPADTVIPHDAAPFNSDLNSSSSASGTGTVISAAGVMNFYNGTVTPTNGLLSIGGGTLVIASTILLTSGANLAVFPPPITGITVRYTTFGDGATISNAPIESGGILILTGTNAYTGATGALANSTLLNVGTLTFGNGTLLVNSPTLAASGSLTITNYPINESDAGSIISVGISGGISGTYKLYSSDAGFNWPTAIGDPISNSTYIFGRNGNVTVITPSDPIPTDPTTIPTSITDGTDATTQITIPTTL